MSLDRLCIIFLEYHKGGETQILKRGGSGRAILNKENEGRIAIRSAKRIIPPLQFHSKGSHSSHPPACIRRNLIISPSFNISSGSRIFWSPRMAHTVFTKEFLFLSQSCSGMFRPYRRPTAADKSANRDPFRRANSVSCAPTQSVRIPWNRTLTLILWVHLPGYLVESQLHELHLGWPACRPFPSPELIIVF
jgi:hypothetical protein